MSDTAADSDRPSVLVADDDPLFRTLSRAALAGDYDVSVAADGHAAVTMALAAPPTAIVLDLSMPGWDGLRVLRAVRADQSLAQTGVLILTSDCDEATIEELTEAGADGFIAKPDFAPDRLRDAVAKLQPTADRGPQREIRRVVPVMAFEAPA